MENRDCGRLIKQINDALEKRANKAVHEQGLTVTQTAALVILESSKERQMPLKRLEQELHVAQSTAAGIVSRLEQKRLVAGYADPEDKRIKLVRLTPLGEQKCQIAKENMNRAEKGFLSCLTEEEAQVFYRLLEKLRDHLI